MKTITIKNKIVSLNKLYNMHWGKRRKLTDEWHELVYWLCREAKLEPVENYPIKLEFDVIFKNKKCDGDNAGGSIKMIIDGLRHADIIEEDTIMHINEKQERYYAGKEDSITVTICDS